jgi:hypothetical protein
VGTRFLASLEADAPQVRTTHYCYHYFHHYYYYYYYY